MDNFYKILDLLYLINRKHPENRFGQLFDSLYNKNIEDLYNLSNEEIIERLEIILKEE